MNQPSIPVIHSTVRYDMQRQDIEGRNGDDKIWGGSGNDKLWGENGSDRIIGDEGDDEVNGGGNDDYLWGSQGNDKLWGEDGNDELRGDDGNDELRGGGNNDKLWGGNGDDKLWGENDNDELYGESGNDELNGGSNDDKIFGGPGNDRLWGESGNDALYGDDGNDQLRGGDNNDKLWGGNGNDELYGESGNDELNGGSNDDKIFGGPGNDRLWGESGNDALYGDDGDDTLDGYGNGDNERDLLAGWAGRDRFILGNSGNVYYTRNGRNDFAEILSFNRDEDTIQLKSLSNNVTNGSKAYGYRLVTVGSDTEIRIDSNDDLIAILRGVTGISFTGKGFAFDGSSPQEIIKQLYRDVFGREADSGGLQISSNQLASGVMTYEQIRQAYAYSAESRDKVNTAYRKILLRDADVGGLQSYQNNLAQGWTLQQVYESISSSTEARSQFWVAQYFNNTDRTGSPVFAESFGRTNTGFDRNWGNGSPSNWVSTDNFSARIFGQVSFGAGRQEISVQSDDGIRVRINGQTIIDRLVDQSFVLNTGIFDAGNGGKFNVEIDYYERGGGAALNFATKALPNIPIGNWKAEFFNNVDRAGTPVIVQDWGSGSQNFSRDWGNSSPSAGINSDNFSARVTTQRYFAPGRHQILTTSDDGVRVIINNNVVIDRLVDQSSVTHTGVFDAGNGGYFNVVLDYYERGGGANLSFNVIDSFKGSTTVNGTSYAWELNQYNKDGKTNLQIDPNKTTIVVAHGRVNKANDSVGNLEQLAKTAAKQFGEAQVLFLDWRNASADTLLMPVEAGKRIGAVANGVAQALRNLGLTNANNLYFYGHSLGSLLLTKVAEKYGKIAGFTSLDPAFAAEEYDLDNDGDSLEDELPDLRSIATRSIALVAENVINATDAEIIAAGLVSGVVVGGVGGIGIVGVVGGAAAIGIAGDNTYARTAERSYIVNFGGYDLSRLTDIPYTFHNAVVDTFTGMLLSGLEVNILASASDISNDQWGEDGSQKSWTNPGFFYHEGVIDVDFSNSNKTITVDKLQFINSSRQRVARIINQKVERSV
ncbi:PA14 domain-containing protein [Nostoc sp.]